MMLSNDIISYLPGSIYVVVFGFFYRILAIMDAVSGYANKERQNLYNQVLPLRSNSVHSIHRCDPGNGRVSDY